MKLSQTVSYAIHASLQLAQSGSSVPVPCSKLATNGQMPERFLLQILRSLVTKGILRSTRGVDGGYALARPASEISLKELMEVFDGDGTVADNIGESFPEQPRKRLQSTFSNVRSLVNRELDSVKLSDLISKDDDQDVTATPGKSPDLEPTS